MKNLVKIYLREFFDCIEEERVGDKRTFRIGFQGSAIGKCIIADATLNFVPDANSVFAFKEARGPAYDDDEINLQIMLTDLIHQAFDGMQKEGTERIVETG